MKKDKEYNKAKEVVLKTIGNVNEYMLYLFMQVYLQGQQDGLKIAKKIYTGDTNE